MKKVLTMKLVITEYLIKNGFDGLADGHGCKCHIGDLIQESDFCRPENCHGIKCEQLRAFNGEDLNEKQI